ncbi:MAG: hypothetical protein IH808_04010 [Proteobacteria bacterium]|nr:hypothetical protein [Pseudomonadota bacterium]
MSLIGFIIPTFLVLVLVGTVWAAGVAWGLDNRWPVALFIGAGLAGALGSVQPVLAVALAVVLWAASFIWGSVVAWKVNKRWPAYLLAASVLLIVIAYLMGLVI